jgi:hypothetical protein
MPASQLRCCWARSFKPLQPRPVAAAPRTGVGGRGDLWAFGAILYEMVTGKRAFVVADISNTPVFVRRDELATSYLGR